MTKPKLPLNFLWGITDPDIQRLMQKVWERLPAYDRAALRELVLEVSAYSRNNDGNVLGSASLANPDTMQDGNVGDIIEDQVYCLELGRVKQARSEAARMFIIAHEFAHVILHHCDMGIVVGALDGLGVYTEPDIEGLTAWHEDAADLLAWRWGFKHELAAFLKEFPRAHRPRWYVELQYDAPKLLSD